MLGGRIRKHGLARFKVILEKSQPAKASVKEIPKKKDDKTR
jgi:hypothetical protein